MQLDEKLIKKKSYLILLHRNYTEYFATALMRKVGDNGNRLLIKVKLPKKNALRVKLTDEGCAVLCSLICLFSRNHAANLSWDGAFDLDSFIVLHGQVHALKPPKPRLAIVIRLRRAGKTYQEYLYSGRTAPTLSISSVNKIN